MAGHVHQPAPPLDEFSEPTRQWFKQAFGGPTDIQRRGWPVIARGEHSLLIAPTGSGKTLAAFLSAIDRCLKTPSDAPPGIRILYVSPLKALVYDVERNLRSPLVGVRHTAGRLGTAVRDIDVDVRTGDTSQRDRRRQARLPSDILVTTPESLFLVLGSNARETLRTVHTVIVDEVHALAPNKRGSHLALSLERLTELTQADPQRIGLSATVHPTEEVAKFLGGDRSVTVVDASGRPDLDVRVHVPVPDMDRVQPVGSNSPGSGSILGQLYAREVTTPAPERGIWSALYPEVLEQILGARSTIVFVNNRGLCERLAQRINDMAGEELVRAHHGSVSHARRREIEEGLKAGKIRAIVATSSLELGIDMGAVDRVLLVESPGSVSRGLQRIGRSGHSVGETSTGRILPKFKGDLLEAAVVAQHMAAGDIEPIRYPRHPLDVLAQQIVAMCCDSAMTVEGIGKVIRRARPYHGLSENALTAVLDMLSGRYPSNEFADLRPLLAWDRSSDKLSARRGATMISRMNAGTIADRGNFAVHLGPDGPKVGELDEEMVFETRTGDTILLGASSWRVEEITRDRVIVTPAPGEPGRLPFWRGDGPGRPIELGEAIGAFVRELDAASGDDTVDWLCRKAPLNRLAAENLANYVREQKQHTGTLPTDRAITVERFRDELGDWRICLLTPFGARLHAPWAMAIQNRLSAQAGFEFQVMYSDDGIVLRLADADELPPLDVLFPEPEDVDDLVTRQLESTALFSGIFRENAARSLLIPRRRPDKRNPLWAQRLKAQQILAAVRRYPSFPVLLETYRQCLCDIFDLPALKTLLTRVRAREVRVDDVETRSASPFARSLVFAYVAAYVYEQDMPVAERKAQALTLDRTLLAELLGQSELREIIDADVLENLEAHLQALISTRFARDPDSLEDLLRRLGDLSEKEIARRCPMPPEDWLEQLRKERRAVPIRIGAEARWIVAPDAGLYIQGLGVVVPAGLPDSFLAYDDRPLEQIVLRYARTHGPFTTKSLAERYNLALGQVLPVLHGLEREGALLRGEIRPGGVEPEWCAPEVLRRLKRDTLAKLRNQVAAVEPVTYARFLTRWHGIGNEPGGPSALLDAIARLEGLPVAWSALCDVILPCRVPGFRPEQLDMLSATGEIVWVGHGALGAVDGRVMLLRRDSAPRLLDGEDEYEAPTSVHACMLEHLTKRGACFFSELECSVRERHPDAGARQVNVALWDLVWTGQITNDTFQPLRALASRNLGRGLRTRQKLAGGRWSRVSDLRSPNVTATERTLARVRVLLGRYGIVSREVTTAEAIPGGFGGVYRTLQSMEEAGRVRRGHFVDGLTGAQFAELGAVDRLRAEVDDNPPGGHRESRKVLLLSSIDPANPYGSVFPWPEPGAETSPRPRRVAGAWVVLVAGTPALYVTPGGRQLITFENKLGDSHENLALALAALRDLTGRFRRKLLIVETVDGIETRESPHRELMTRCGFVNDYRGLSLDAGRASA